MVEMVRYFAQQASASISSSSRPACTFFVIQLFGYLSVQYGADVNAALGMNVLSVAIDPQFSWLVNPVLIMLSGALAAGEILAQHDDDVSSFMNDFNLHQYINAFGAFSTALLLSMLDASTFEGLNASSYLGPGGGNELAQTAKTVIESSPEAASWEDRGKQLAIIVGSVGGNQILSYYRGQLHEWLDDLSLLKVWQRIESGGILVALVILILAPILCLILLILALIAGAIIGLIVRKVSAVLDQRARVACPHCETMIRGEASLCYACSGVVTPTVMLNNDSKVRGLIETLQMGRQKTPEAIAPS